MIDLREAFDGPFDPRIVALLTDYKVQVVRVAGEFVRQSHPTIQLRDRGVEHCPRSEGTPA